MPQALPEPPPLSEPCERAWRRLRIALSREIPAINEARAVLDALQLELEPGYHDHDGNLAGTSLAMRTVLKLEALGIYTIEDLIATPESTLSKQKMVGPGMLREIRLFKQRHAEYKNAE